VPAFIESDVVPRAAPRAVRETMLRRTLDAAWVAANDLAGTPVPTHVHALVATNPLLDRYTMIVAADGDDADVLAALRRAATHGPATVVVLALEDPRGETTARSVTVGALGDLDALRSWRVAVAPPPRLDLPPSVRGGSIGLVAALLYVDRVTPGDLSGGLLIAASGAIDPSGIVGRVASLPWKLDAAARARASTVLVPTANADDLDGLPARTGPSALDVGPLVLTVASLSDAVAVLCRGGSAAACSVAGAASP
jgi:PDZ domain-containing protein